jgi:hypothetical protein
MDIFKKTLLSAAAIQIAAWSLGATPAHAQSGGWEDPKYCFDDQVPVPYPPYCVTPPPPPPPPTCAPNCPPPPPPPPLPCVPNEPCDHI